MYHKYKSKTSTSKMADKVCRGSELIFYEDRDKN